MDTKWSHYKVKSWQSAIYSRNGGMAWSLGNLKIVWFILHTFHLEKNLIYFVDAKMSGKAKHFFLDF